MVEVYLTYGVGGRRAIRLRKLTGDDERRAGGRAHALLRLLAVPGKGLVSGRDIDRLPLCDRDQALAALYTALYGDAVTADAACAECGERFEQRFSMSRLSQSRAPRPAGEQAALAWGRDMVRLPTAQDLAAAESGGPRALLSLLCPAASGRDWSDSLVAAVSRALERANPTLDLDLSGRCPECGALNLVRFSMVWFMNAALAGEAGALTREIHQLATAYGWSHESILALPREERRQFVRLVLADRGGAARMRGAA